MVEHRLTIAEQRLSAIEGEIANVRSDLTELLEVFRAVKQGRSLVSWVLRSVVYIGGVCFAIASIWIFIVWVKTGVLPGTEGSALLVKPH